MIQFIMNYEPIKDAPPGLTIADSAVVGLRASWAVLEDDHFDPFPQPESMRSLAKFLNRLPSSWRIKIADYISVSISHPHTDFDLIDPESSAEWVISGFTKEKYHGVILGAPGLAAAFLSGITGYPFLPQPLLYNARRDMSKDDAQAYLDAGREIAEPLVKKFNDIEATIHFDPVHDRFLIGRVVFVRLKYLTLPLAYRKFIEGKLEPGSPVILLDCRFKWLRTEIADRLFFQLGGLGGISPGEMLEDSEVLRTYRKRWGATNDANWKAKGKYIEGPESEWGSTGTFLEEAGKLASTTGHKPILVSHNHPGDLTKLVTNLYLNQWKGAGKPRDAYIGVFTHTEPRFPMVTGAIPIWLPFITDDNIPLLKSILSDWKSTGSDRDGTAFITLHPSFCSPPDLVQLETWRTILEKYFNKVEFPGVDPGRYPSDLGSYVAVYPEITKAARENSFDGEPFKTPDYDDLIKIFGGVQGIG